GVHQTPRIRRRRASGSLSGGGTWVSGGAAIVSPGAASSRFWTRWIELMRALSSRSLFFSQSIDFSTMSRRSSSSCKRGTGALAWRLKGHLYGKPSPFRSEEHTSELQSRFDLVCRLLLE